MTHYKMNDLHLGGGESLSTLYRRSDGLPTQKQNRKTKLETNKKSKPMRQAQES